MRRKLLVFIATFIALSLQGEVEGQTIAQNKNFNFAISGYLRTGVGASKNGATQANFQMPGALNKFSLANQADTYGELQFSYTQFFGANSSKYIEAIWMSSIYEPFGSKDKMSFNGTEQLYLKINNIFNRGETIWIGKRFYDRYAIHILDRQWLNPGQGGVGLGMENLLNRVEGEDIKFGLFGFRDRDVTSYKNGKVGDLYNFTADLRWVGHPLSSTLKINGALNYSFRSKNRDLGYRHENGVGVFSWLDYSSGNITNTTAILFRQGANISADHWTGRSERENPYNDKFITSNLRKSYTIELNNNFLYDSKSSFAINAIVVGLIRNYGVAPYYYKGGSFAQEEGGAVSKSSYSSLLSLSAATMMPREESVVGLGKMFYWLAFGVRPIYYISKQFRLTAEITQELVNNKQLDASGSLTKLSFSPELALSKGFYSRPVLRPFINFAFWSRDLTGYIGNNPSGAPYGDKQNGFTYGLQLEIWW